MKGHLQTLVFLAEKSTARIWRTCCRWSHSGTFCCRSLASALGCWVCSSRWASLWLNLCCYCSCPGFDERLLSWHLGCIFGHPMLAAQAVVAHAQRQHGGERAMVVGFGLLVDAYALGALIGSALRSFIAIFAAQGPARAAWLWWHCIILVLTTL
mmetsp:Transcript_20193/g.63251  ORF Transcript_20193/g.63251 Transcript_20193/m.63251 type:complete len:155 (-) Transcript_20193:80-544(-)